MKMQNTKTAVRVITLILALIVVAGTFLGLIGSMLAYAEPTPDGTPKPEIYAKFNVNKPYFEQINNNGGTYEPEVGYTYTVSTSLIIDKDLVNSTGTWNKKDIPTMTLTSDCFKFKNGNVFKSPTSDSPTSDKKQYKYDYSLDGVVPLASSNPSFDVKIAHPALSSNGTGDDNWKVTFINNELQPTPSSSTEYFDDSSKSTSSDDDEDPITTPKMIITGFEIPDEVNFGEEFQVTITFLNNSKTKNMENISMTVTPSEGVAIKNGVNKRHYVKIPRRQSTSETFTLRASSQLAAESLSLTVKFDYQYKYNNEYKDGTSEEVLSILSVPKPTETPKDTDEKGSEGSISGFEILSVIPPENVIAGEEAYVTVKVINKDHQFDASNVQLTVSGEGLTNAGNTEYHGALAHSSQAEIETALNFEKEGTYTLTATVIYEDSVGFDEDKKPIVRINSLTKDFTVTVEGAPDMSGMMGGMGMDGMGMGGMEEGIETGGQPTGVLGFFKSLTPLQITLSSCGVVLLVVTIVLSIRFIRRKKAEAEDETV